MPVVQDLHSLRYARYLQPFAGVLDHDGDHTEIHFDRAQFDDAQASGSRFSESAITAVTFSGGAYERVRLDDVWIARSRWIGGFWADAQLIDVAILDSVLAGVQAYRTSLRRVVLQGCKLDSLNLRGAKLQDVEFRDCDLSEVDFAGATLTGVTFPGSAIRQARFDRVTVKKLDLRGARELDITQGWDHLRGAVINSGQLVQAAPATAQTLGIVVQDR